ncbi:hypothetical protein SHIRM173S_10311 [Streptomyces hirsutus]
MLPNQVNRCRTGAVGSPAGLSSVTAKARTSTAAMPVWSSDPVPGAPLVPVVRPKAEGSRPSRPMAKAYRATTLWKLSMAANMPVTKRMCRTSVKVPPSRDSVRKNSSPALCSCEVATMPAGPVATVRAQLADREEHGDARDGQEHHARHQDVRPAGLLGVHRGLFEAEEGRDAEAQGGADAGAGEGVRVEGVQRQPFLARVGDGGDVEDDDQEHLDDQQDAEHARVHVDLQPAQRADGGEGHQRRYPPGDLEVGVGGEESRHLEAEDAVDADLEGVVGDQRDHRGARAGGAAEAAGDVRVEGSGVVDVPAHLGVSEAEQHQHDAEDDEEQRLAHDAHHRECGGHDTRDHHEGSGRGEHGEQQTARAETVGTQGALLPLEGADAVRCGSARARTARTVRRHRENRPWVGSGDCAVGGAWRVERAGFRGVAGVTRCRGRRSARCGKR